ncbi:MAG: hypothetical protein CL878_06655 [Dehalococcoidia bacterium]|nr:hypothetical protein [Dehalococcoidia bacterium]
MNERLLAQAQWTTGSRLLKLGEQIEFQFYLPAGTEASDLSVFPRYLEQAHPGEAFVAGGDLAWLDTLESERLPLTFANGRAALTYRPQATGSYLARWQAGDELFYRYFSVIEDDWIVVRFSTFIELDVNPTLHATGIPLDHRLPIDRFDPDDSLFVKLLAYHRHFGDTVTPVLPDTPLTGSEAKMSPDDRVRLYGRMMEKVRSLLPDQSDARVARIELWHDYDPGYVEALARVGVNNHFGLREANADYWLGMPEFPYFASPIDTRKMHQGESGEVVVHQWDFCGGFHFLGPVRYHYGVSEGQWDRALECLQAGVNEAQNLVELSGHPAFLVPLYDGVTKYYPVSSGLFNEGYLGQPMFDFVAKYQGQMAFEFPKRHKLAYARSIDIADYYRRHFPVTPRTVFVSKSDHIDYDKWWLCTWGDDHFLVPRERIPWLTRMSSVFEDRQQRKPYKDPLSHEYILIEDQQRQLRFERESPNPIWWFDYTVQERGPLGSAITSTQTPDVDIARSEWVRNGTRMTITLNMHTSATFDDYAIALWNVPAAYSPDRSRIETNAKDFVLAKNADGEFHVVLFFDLKPGASLTVTV